jgi:hypothetical protein
MSPVAADGFGLERNLRDELGFDLDVAGARQAVKQSAHAIDAALGLGVRCRHQSPRVGGT